MNSPNLNDWDERSYQGILEEYRALRAEVIAQFQNRNNLLTFGSATLGILFSVAAGIGNDIDLTVTDLLQRDFNSLKLKASVIVLAITVPLICSLIIFLWGAYSSRVTQIGHYLMSREDAVNAILQRNIQEVQAKDKVLYWENHLRIKKDSDELRQALAITVIFTAISFTSILTAQEVVQILAQGSLIVSTHFSSEAIRVFSWLFLSSGFLSGVYRIYKIKQSLRCNKKGHK